MTRKEFGERGEYLARLFLEKKGYLFIRSNYVIKGGEIDLIMQENDEIVFLEVKTRTVASAKAFGRGADAVNAEKIKRIRRTARQFLREETNLTKDLLPRFDVIELYFEDEFDTTVRVFHHPCAF